MYNKVVMIGRLAKKPELKTNSSGDKAYTRFSIAVNSFSNGKEDTQWFDITAFGKVAEVCSNNLDKGSVVMVEGKLQINEYEKDKIKHKTTNIVADRIVFLSPKSNTQQQQNQTEVIPQQTTGEVFGSEVADDIPF